MNALLWWQNGIARWWNDKCRWWNGNYRWWNDDVRWWNANFRWWNARQRWWNAVPAEFNHCPEMKFIPVFPEIFPKDIKWSFFMSPLRRHIFVCFMGKRGVFGPSSAKRGRTHIVLRWNMSGVSTSTYPENLGSGGQLPAELRGQVCLFCFFVRFFVCLSRYDARHRKPRRCIYALNLGGTGISPPDSFSYRSNFRFRSSFRFHSRFRSRSSSSSTTSGDIFYCSGSRQLNHSSCCFKINKWNFMCYNFINK